MNDLPLSTTSHLLGALAALGSAFLWAVSAILFSRLGVHLSAISMNIGKGLVALGLMAVWVLPGGVDGGDWRTLGLLGASAIMGICLGDTLYFLTLMRLGSRITLLLGSMIPITTAAFAVLFLGETVTGMAAVGAVLTITGVTSVLWERDHQPVTAQQRFERRQGLWYGALFVLANALGIICTKVGVADIPSLDATLIRQAWALLGFFVWAGFTRQLWPWLKPLTNPAVIKALFVAAFLGAFLGTWFSVLALKYTDASVAAVLNSTSPLFILPLAVWWLKETVTLRSVVGAVLAVAGIGLYFFSFV